MWKQFARIAEQLFERQGLLLMIVGAAFMILAASKGIRFHDWFTIEDLGGRIAAFLEVFSYLQ
jgi:hypothetical protein